MLARPEKIANSEGLRYSRLPLSNPYSPSLRNPVQVRMWLSMMPTRPP